MEGLPVRYADVKVEGCGTAESARILQDTIRAVEGVEEVSFTDSTLRIRYCPQFVLLPYIREQITEAGFSLPAAEQTREKKGLFRRFLDRLIESNEKAFGNERLDCCSLNSRKKKE